MNKLLLWLTRGMPARAIDLHGRHYIERYHVLEVGRLHVVLHRYLGCDGDRHAHDHPWRWCLGVPLTGGYTEERVLGFCPERGWVSTMTKIRPWRWNYINSARFHRIARVEKGTWTLFVTFGRFKSWSFAHKVKGGVDLRQPLDLRSTHGWWHVALRGEVFRAARRTDK